MKPRVQRMSPTLSFHITANHIYAQLYLIFDYTYIPNV